ncbi:ClpX C4-type zinc finger protein [Sciscionella sediminilitoris]|uniref:ClpX C4-type zinc finger protein n=1 Tax=Sciscionella sediminilitoris TaxID=1445613 RepID=UPI0004DF02D6|nr:ClpX C4-type zinc finger protein [Sciscionella sp. SE31]
MSPDDQHPEFGPEHADSTRYNPERLPESVRKIYKRFRAPCSFCGTYAEYRHLMISAGDHETYMCDQCVTEAAHLIAGHHAAPQGTVIELGRGETR